MARVQARFHTAPTTKSGAVAPPAPLSSHEFTPEEAAAEYCLFVRKVVPPPPPPLSSAQVTRNALEALTAAGLRAQLTALSLKGYGKKGELVDRIIAAHPAPTPELLAAEFEARRVARAVVAVPTSEWMPLGEILIPEEMVPVQGYLDGAVLERYDALSAHSKRLHMKMLPITAAEALEFGTQRRAAAEEAIIAASEAALEEGEEEEEEAGAGGEAGAEEEVEEEEEHEDHDDHDDMVVRAELRLTELIPSKFAGHVKMGGEEERKATGINGGLNSKETGELVQKAFQRLSGGRHSH